MLPTRGTAFEQKHAKDATVVPELVLIAAIGEVGRRFLRMRYERKCSTDFTDFHRSRLDGELPLQCQVAS